MPLTRRRFLQFSAAGLAVASAGCQPPRLELQALEMANDSRLAEKARLARHKNRFLGYPVNMSTPPEAFFAWRRQLQETGLTRFAYNNVGNPYHHSPIPFNTHDFERELIENFAAVYAFPKDDVWGFLSHSGTDSNMHGMYIGRTLLKGQSGKLPKCYFTPEAHYSIQILTDLLGLERVFVGTLPDASMDPDDLARKVNANRDVPALVVATTGTTFKGAIDRVDAIKAALGNHPHYLHLDAALFGGYLPYTEDAEEVKHKQGRYDSIAVSCHKFFGFHSPAGIFITRHSTFETFNRLFSRVHTPEYIGHVPGTITCSRDAVKPAEFWFFSRPEDRPRQRQDAKHMLTMTDYLMAQMEAHFPHLRPVRAGQTSNTIWFRKPADWIVEKYSLATMTVKGTKHAHVVVMPHVDRQVADAFLDDLAQEHAA
ncbi:histidine decarboxylase [Methylomarinovum tepidoasis]|uniref:Histidine decarboxylase n=1 Tax=Methylomarinovum tepidoasis TaxID=2840183 RepID=A0AAU9C8W4_9GAMM|nr:pyridoxal-dependent decarboxylase [Methylomarinovum sp. IN45]BCX89719.1 histidine decarboxylase [Methylomarinovum sp. IN45]